MCKASALGLALLGFTACSETAEDMYGTPTGTFEIKGAVTAESDGSTVEGASIAVKPNGINYPINHPVVCDDKGNYTVKEVNHPFDKVRVVCTPGADSGLAADSVDVELKYHETKESKKDSWNVGTAESRVNFKLKAKPAKADKAE